MLLSNTFAVLTAGLATLVGAQKQYAITGVSVDPGKAAPLRKNINDLQAAGGPQWDLYIQALRSMYQVDATNPLSFFQVAGIHGRPYVEWNGGGAENTDGWEGYCPHGEKLFVTWHRPYVLLFEQLLVQHATNIANQYPQRYRAQYQEAAKTLRAPFWDWASNSNVPPVTAQSKITVNVPNGNNLRTDQIDNPLLTYIFPKVALEDGEFGLYDSQDRTQIFRCRDNGDSYPASANQRMSRRPYKQWVYDAFTHSKDFAEFASTAAAGVSLEQIHNGVHWDAACGGQFLDADFSAFDPIFMMHHANVDRLWAYWQAIRPKDSIFGIAYNGGARYSTPKNTRITPDSPLQPFYSKSGNYHTSKSIEKINGLGYSYERLEYWSKSADQMKTDATRLINRLYGPNNARKVKSRALAAKETKYFARVELDVTEVERPCSVSVIIHNKLVGEMVVMKQPESGIVHGGFDLQEASIPLPFGLSVDKIVTGLMDGVEVRIVTASGKKINPSTVHSLKIELENVVVQLPTSDAALPVFGVSKLHKVVDIV